MSHYLAADTLQFHSCRKILALMFKCNGNKEGSKSGDKCINVLWHWVSASLSLPFAPDSCLMLCLYCCIGL